MAGKKQNLDVVLKVTHLCSSMPGSGGGWGAGNKRRTTGQVTDSHAQFNAADLFIIRRTYKLMLKLLPAQPINHLSGHPLLQALPCRCPCFLSCAPIFLLTPSHCVDLTRWCSCLRCLKYSPHLGPSSVPLLWPMLLMWSSTCSL